VTGVTAGLMQGRTGVFAERMQGRLLYVLGYSASVFGNSVSMLIAALGLSGHSNGYQATVTIARNNYPLSKVDCPQSTLLRIKPVLIKKPGGIYVHPSQEKEWLVQP
jgi:hypothetical protein